MTNPTIQSILRELEEKEVCFCRTCKLMNGEATHKLLESRLLSFGAEEYKRGQEEADWHAEKLMTAYDTGHASGVAEERERLRKVAEGMKHQEDMYGYCTDRCEKRRSRCEWNIALDSILQALSNPSKEI